MLLPEQVGRDGEGAALQEPDEVVAHERPQRVDAPLVDGLVRVQVEVDRVVAVDGRVGDHAEAARQLPLLGGGNSIALKKGPKISGPFSVHFSGALFVLLNLESNLLRGRALSWRSYRCFIHMLAAN